MTIRSVSIEELRAPAAIAQVLCVAGQCSNGITVGTPPYGQAGLACSASRRRRELHFKQIVVRFGGVGGISAKLVRLRDIVKLLTAKHIGEGLTRARQQGHEKRRAEGERALSSSGKMNP